MSGYRAVLGSEWTKLASVRSTYLSMALAIVVAVAGGMFGAHGAANEWATMSAARRADFDPVNISYDGLAFAQIAFGVLGVLAITTEYATGMIRTTFTATPRRHRVLVGKAITVGGIALALGETFSFVTFLLAQPFMRAQHLDVALTDHGVLRAVAGAGLYLAALALIGLGLGSLIRHTAGAVSAMFTLVFVIPILSGTVDAWTSVPTKWNLWSAGNALVSINPPTGNQPSAWQALLACLVYVAAILGAGFAAIVGRDA